MIPSDLQRYGGGYHAVNQSRPYRVDWGLLSYLVLAGSGWNMSPAYLIATGLATATTVRLLKESQRASASS